MCILHLNVYACAYTNVWLNTGSIDPVWQQSPMELSDAVLWRFLVGEMHARISLMSSAFACLAM